VQPLPPVQRDTFLDAVRGLALGGILAVNLEHFAGAGMYATLHGLSENYTRGREILAFFFSGKFYTIFAILFGLGLALQYQRFVMAGLDARALLRRRLGWLLGLGALHGIFLFDGDILGTYAILGLFALRYLGQEHRLLDIGKFLLGGYILLFWFAILLRDQMPTPGSGEVFLTGSFWQVTGVRLETWLFNTPLASLVFGAEIVGLFLLGVYLAPRWNTIGPATLWQVVALGLLVGIPVNLYNALHFDTQPLRGLGGLSFALAYLALFRLLWPRLGRMQALHYAGRMPLSNYLLQSVAMSLLFYGYGLGWFGQVSPFWFPAIAAGFVVFQVLLSRWWLQRFAQGPLEWLWRKFTYRR
jgi:uncharacterized protein